MRYVIADTSGKSHAYFDRRVDARDGLREIVEDEPDAIDEFYLSGFDEAGVRVFGPQSARSALESRGLPVALVVRELRACVRRYLKGEIERAAFRDGLLAATRGLDEADGYGTALDLRAQIEQQIANHPDEARLKADLAALAPSWWATEVKDLVGRETLQFA